MGRNRVVELDEVVARAMACFREHGFEATSIRELEVVTGLKASSIYKAFGSKAGLFAETLDRYRTDVVDRRISVHLQPDRGLAGIYSFFCSTYTTEPDPSHGCLLTNSAVEWASITLNAQHKVEQGLARIRDAFAEQLGAAKANSELNAAVDTGTTADALLVFYEGLLALLRTGQSLSLDLDRTIDASLRSLLPRTTTGAS